MKLGLMTVSAADLELDGVMELAAREKLDGVELAAAYLGKFRGDSGERTWHIDTTNLLQSAEHAALLARKLGLEIFSFASRCGLEDLELFESLCRAAQSIGCPQVRIGSGSYDRALGYMGSVERSRAGLSRAVDIAERYGIKAVFELHENTMADGVLASWLLLRDFDPNSLGVIFDAANTRGVGFQPWPEALDILQDYVAHVHCKNLYLEREGDALKYVHAGPEEGLCDWPPLLEELKRRGYEGWLSIEDYRGGWCQKNPDWPTERKVREWRDYLRPLMD